MLDRIWVPLINHTFAQESVFGGGKSERGETGGFSKNPSASPLSISEHTDGESQRVAVVPLPGETKKWKFGLRQDLGNGFLPSRRSL